MKQFEDVVEAIVQTMEPVQIKTGDSRPVRFYWGTTEDLPDFLKVYKERHFPLVWSVSRPDFTTLDGYRRNAELCFCTRETRSILNTERMEKAFAKLLAMWEDFDAKASISGNIVIQKEDISLEKIPRYSVRGLKKESPVMDVWDVLKVSFTANFYEDFNC